MRRHSTSSSAVDAPLSQRAHGRPPGWATPANALPFAALATVSSSLSRSEAGSCVIQYRRYSGTASARLASADSADCGIRGGHAGECLGLKTERVGKILAFQTRDRRPVGMSSVTRAGSLPKQPDAFPDVRQHRHGGLRTNRDVVRVVRSAMVLSQDVKSRSRAEINPIGAMCADEHHGMSWTLCHNQDCFVKRCTSSCDATVVAKSPRGGCRWSKLYNPYRNCQD